MVALWVGTGGNFLEGFAACALGSWAGSGWQSLGGFAKSGVGMIGFSALTGGVGAEISGGNFWDGFRNGAITSTLNHVAHMLTGDQDQPKPKKKGSLQEHNKELLSLNEGLLKFYEFMLEARLVAEILLKPLEDGLLKRLL